MTGGPFMNCLVPRRLAVDPIPSIPGVERKKIPVLWVTGAPGVGKSTTGWGLFTRVSERGGSVAYVDIDQLGLIGPPPGGGPRSHEIKADILLRVVAALHRRAVQQVIVSGVVDPANGIDPRLTHSEQVDLTLVRLDCAREELRNRFLGRGSSADSLPELFDVVDELRRSAFGIALDTTEQHADETVDALLEHCVVRTLPADPSSSVAPDGALQMPVVIVTGATAVGKSTAAWGVLRHLWESDVATAYVDLEQLGFASPGPDSLLRSANLAAVSRGYRKAGARLLILVTRELDSAVWDVLADEVVTVVQLDADGAVVADRVRRRADGEAALLAGDELRGAPLDVQRQVVARAAAEADRLRRAEPHPIVLDTSWQNAQETTAALLDVVRPVLEGLPPERDVWS